MGGEVADNPYYATTGERSRAAGGVKTTVKIVVFALIRPSKAQKFRLRRAPGGIVDGVNLTLTRHGLRRVKSNDSPV